MVLENLDKIMHLRFNFDACPMHSPFGFVHLTHQNQARSQGGCRGCNAPPKSAKRSTFSHKVGQKWGFCRRVWGWGSESPLFGSKRSTFWGFRTPPKIDPGYGPDQNLSARALFCLNSLAKVNTQLLIYNYVLVLFQEFVVIWHELKNHKLLDWTSDCVLLYPV